MNTKSHKYLPSRFEFHIVRLKFDGNVLSKHVVAYILGYIKHQCAAFRSGPLTTEAKHKLHSLHATIVCQSFIGLLSALLDGHLLLGKNLFDITLF